ncbi:MAG: substrate-binding domain-containing protein [Acidobacteriaceae bacterium]|nr:substrate-binding domain-containing protein [Acidobacteriaceae bacterium]
MIRNSTLPRNLILSASAAAFLTLTSCAPLPHDPKERYVLVSTNIKVPYWQAAFQGLSRAATEMKVRAEMVGPDTYDTRAEHDEFRRAVSEKPSGILVSAADATVITPDINSALQQGIPVVTIDSDAPNSNRLFFIGTDNYNAGKLGGNLMANLLNGKGNVVIFTMPNQENLNERLRGYQSSFDPHSGIKISQIVDIKGDPTIAFDTTKQLISSKSKVDAFVCLEAIACPEVGEVINRENMGGKFTIVAMDADQRTLNWIQKGVISATVAQKPYTMAYFGAKLLDGVHHHPPPSLVENWRQNSFSPLPTFVDTGTSIVNKDNVASVIQEIQSHSGAQ